MSSVVADNWGDIPDIDEMHYASSMDKAVEFIKRCLEDEEISEDEIIQIDVDYVDSYFDRQSKSIGRAAAENWIENL